MPPLKVRQVIALSSRGSLFSIIAVFGGVHLWFVAPQVVGHQASPSPAGLTGFADSNIALAGVMSRMQASVGPLVIKVVRGNQMCYRYPTPVPMVKRDVASSGLTEPVGVATVCCPRASWPDPSAGRR
jgi:hypothetical protein